MSELFRMQHKYRRDGGITVGGKHHELDAEGCVEVIEETAAKLDQGANWRPYGDWPAGADTPPASPQAPAGSSKGTGRRPRTRSELEAAAADSGEAGGLREEGVASGIPGKSHSRLNATHDPRPGRAERAQMEAKANEPTPDEGVDTAPAPTETVTVSMDMSRAELLTVARDLEADVPGSATKAQIIEAIQGQGD